MGLGHSLRWNGREFTMINISRSLIVSRRSSASSRESDPRLDESAEPSSGPLALPQPCEDAIP
ncbi:hypothetical protein HYFRA_00007371 [Hymenoscyphus fraxineus]|uniref:Uncharacterized protein n=1 Tax=Hymenoscyphus fraxineus TaxID=746836 RepID=A0A9N9PPW7_9HELO|nr:hypothetical protein HYFRA_00007371 [Hymenoscyphus fraxineus]